MCACFVREFCVSSSSALCARGGAGQHAQQTHFLHGARAFGFLSLTYKHARASKHTQKKETTKKKKNVSTRKLHAALSHTLSLSLSIYLRCVLSGWRSCSAALFSARHCVRLCVCVCVCGLEVCQRWRYRLCRFHYKLFSRAVRVVVVAVAAKSSRDDVRVPSLRQ